MTNLETLHNWIESNPGTIADWVVDMAYDERPQPRGPLFGQRVCDDFADSWCEKWSKK